MAPSEDTLAALTRRRLLAALLSGLAGVAILRGLERTNTATRLQENIRAREGATRTTNADFSSPPLVPPTDPRPPAFPRVVRTPRLLAR